MSTTRRSTRSRRPTASPSISEQDIPSTPAVTRPSPRKNAAETSPLPSVNLRASSAYGTNSTTSPTLLKGPENHDQIQRALSNVLEPVREESSPEKSPVRRGRAPPTTRGKGRTRAGAASAVGAEPSTVGVEPQQPVDKSFAHESAIFGTAGLDSSSFAADSDLDITTKFSNAKAPVFESAHMKAQLPLINEIVRDTRVEQHPQDETVATTPAVAAPSPMRFLSYATDLVTDIVSYIGEFLMTILSNIILMLDWLRDVVLSTQGKTTMLVVAVLIASFGALSQIDQERSLRWYGVGDISHNIGQILPYSLSHPLSLLQDGAIRDLGERLTAVEYNIAHLQHSATVDRKALNDLEKILPDTIVCQKDDRGNLKIPDNFWYALRDKIRSENSLLESRFSKTESASTSSTGISKKEVISIAQQQAEQIMDQSSTKTWEKFLNTNRAKIMSWFDDSIEGQIAELRKDVLTPKSDFMAMIEENLANTKSTLLAELSPHQKTLDLIRSRVSKLEKGAIAATKDEVRAIATDVAKNLIFSAQFAPLAESNIQNHAKLGLLRVNHFSPGTGASTNPKLTSPNFVFPSMKVSMITKLRSWAFFTPVRGPNPPVTALTRWEEHGDCWCSPLNAEDRVWPTLGVLLGNKIYPEQVIIEHIPTTASLEPGSAPKEMELWAFIEDRALREKIEARSMDFFQEEKNPDGLVKIGTWTYDIESTQHIQTFPLEIDLALFGDRAFTNNMMVRVKSNWGGSRVNYSCLYRVRVNGKIAEKTA